MSHVRNLWSGKAPLDITRLAVNPAAEVSIIHRPEDEFTFLHDCMITAFHGRLYTAWYNCTAGEMRGRSVIRGRVSCDSGKTWSKAGMIAEDPDFVYAPATFIEDRGALWLMTTRMIAPDVVRNMDLFRLDEPSGTWRFVRTFEEPFLPNSKAVRLPDGKLIIGGRVAPKRDEFPEIPAVAVSDSGSAEGPWRIVRIHDLVKAPDRENPFPETSLVVEGNSITAFVRHDNRYPLMYESADGGETWSGPLVHNIPCGASKIYASLLPGGRRCMIANLARQGRSTLALFLSEPGEKTFSSASLLRSGPDALLDARPQWSYPDAVFADGCLFAVCTSEKTSAAFFRIKL